jgi:hypothetical protein
VKANDGWFGEGFLSGKLFPYLKMGSHRVDIKAFFSTIFASVFLKCRKEAQPEVTRG